MTNYAERGSRVLSTERRVVEYAARGNQYIVYPIDKIESATDAYIVGMLAADGSFSVNPRGYVRCTLSSSEKFVINGIINEYMPLTPAMDRSNRDIDITNSQGKTYHYHNREHYEVNISAPLINSLRKFGIICPKPERVISGIPQRYMSAYILGFFDGDGSVVVRHRKDCRTPRLSIHFVTGATRIAEQIQNELANRLNIASSIYQRNENCVDLRINHTERSVQFCQWIYSDLPKFYSFKKKNIFDSYYESCVRSGELRESDTPIRSQASEN